MFVCLRVVSGDNKYVYRSSDLIKSWNIFPLSSKHSASCIVWPHLELRLHDASRGEAKPEQTLLRVGCHENGYQADSCKHEAQVGTLFSLMQKGRTELEEGHRWLSIRALRRIYLR